MFIFDRSISSYHLNKMNIKTNLLEDHVTFADITRKQNAHFHTIIVSFFNIISLFSFYLLFKYLNE